MPKIKFDVNVANGVAIDVANGVLPVLWMGVYHFCFNESNQLLNSVLNLVISLS